MNKNKRRCPICSGKGVASGINTLAFNGRGICIKCNGEGFVHQSVIDEVTVKMKDFL